MVSADDAERIRAIFLHDGRSVSVARAARLLGWSSERMHAAMKSGVLALKISSSGPSVRREELLWYAAEQWPFSVIEEALGPDGADRLPPGMRMRPLLVPVHRYASDMLDYLAAKTGASVETLLAQVLDAYSIAHIHELVANVPSYRDALGSLPEAKIKDAYEPVRRTRRP